MGAPPPSPPAGRTGSHRLRTPATEVEGAVLDAAARLLGSEGPDSLSIRRIAAEADVAPMSIYNRFGNKAGIVDALFRRGFDRLAAAFRASHAGDALDTLRLSGHRYRELALADPGSYAVMFEHAVADYEPSDEARTHGAAAFAALVELTEQARADGHFGDQTALDIAQLFWAACHGAVSLELRGMGFVADRDASYALLIEVLLTGFGAPGAR